MLTSRARLVPSAKRFRQFSTSTTFLAQRQLDPEERSKNIDITSLQETLRAHKQRPREQRWKRNVPIPVRTPSRRKKLSEREAQLKKDFTLVPAPWLASRDLKRLASPSQRLSVEMQALTTYLEPELYESALRDEIVERLRSITANTIPSARLDVHGSLATGLCTSFSDIDLIIDTSPEDAKPVKSREKNSGDLMRLRRALANDPSIHSAQVTPARISLIEAVDLATMIPIQMSFGRNDFPKKLIGSYLEEFPQLKPLLFVTRRLLASHGLSDPFIGGIGSYTILNMIIAYLKLGRDQEPSGPPDLGQQFLDFLRFYADFDTVMRGISVEPPLIFDKHFADERASKAEKESWVKNPGLRRRYAIAIIRSDQPWLLCLQDPANPSNDLGSKSYEFRAVQLLFRRTADELERRMQLEQQQPVLEIDTDSDQPHLAQSPPTPGEPSCGTHPLEMRAEDVTAVEEQDEEKHKQQQQSLLQPVINMDIPQLQRLRTSWRMIYEKFHSSNV